MKKTLRRILSLVLILSFVAGFLPQQALSAAETDYDFTELFDTTSKPELRSDTGAFSSKVRLFNSISELYIHHARVLGNNLNDSRDRMALYFHRTANNSFDKEGAITNLSRLSSLGGAVGGPIALTKPSEIMASAQQELCLGTPAAAGGQDIPDSILYKKDKVAMMTVRSSNSNNMFGSVGTPTTLTMDLFIIEDPTSSESSLSNVDHFTASYAPTLPDHGYGYGNHNIYDNALSLATGDLNGDLIDEIVVSYVMPSEDRTKHEVYLRIYTYSTSSKTWTKSEGVKVYETNHTAQNPLMSLAVGDFSGDKLDDIAIAVSAPAQPAVLASPFLVTTSKTAVVTTFLGNTAGANAVLASADSEKIQVGDLLAAGVSIVDTGIDGKLDLLVGGWSIHNVDEWKENDTRVEGTSPVLSTQTSGQQVVPRLLPAPFSDTKAHAAIQTFYSFRGGSLLQESKVYGINMAISDVRSFTNQVADNGYASYGGVMASAVSLTAAHMKGSGQDPLIVFNNCWYSKTETEGYRFSWDLQALTNVSGKDTSASTTNPFNALTHSYNMRAVNIGDPFGRESIIVKVRGGDSHVQDIAIISYNDQGNDGGVHKDNLVMDVTSRTLGNRPLSFSCPDTDQDAIKLELREKDPANPEQSAPYSGVVYSDPIVLAALVAPPYHRDFLHRSGPGDIASSYMDSASVSFGSDETTGSGGGSSYSISGGLYFGYEQEFSVFGIKLFHVDFETEVSAGFTTEVERFRSVSTGYHVKTTGEDAVLISTLPYDVYCYDVYSPDAEGQYASTPDEGVMTVHVPHAARFALIKTETYNEMYQALKDTMDLPDLQTDVFSKYIIGDPTSYSAENLGTGVQWGKDISVETGAATSGLVITEEARYSTETHQSLAFKLGGGAGGVKAGITSEQVWGQKSISSTSQSTSFDLEFGRLHPELAAYGFTLKLAVYNLPYASRSANSVLGKDMPGTAYVPVVTTVASNFKLNTPPSLPAVEDIYIAANSSSSITLAWKQDETAGIDHYEAYLGYGPGQAMTRIGTVKVVPGQADYSFDYTLLSKGNTYTMAIRAVGENGVRSLLSVVRSGTVRTEGIGAVEIVTDINDVPTPMDGENKTLILDAATKAVTLNAKATPSASNVPRKAIAWQQLDNGVWNDIPDTSYANTQEIYSYNMDNENAGLPNVTPGFYRLAYIEYDSNEAIYPSYSPTFEIAASTNAVESVQIVIDHDTILVPDAGSVTLEPRLFATYSNGSNKAISSGAVWAIDNIADIESAGISLDSVTGVITVGSSAAASAPVALTLSATFNDIKDTAAIKVERAASYTLSASASNSLYQIPSGDTPNTYELSCGINDQYNQAVAGGSVTWQLQDSVGTPIAWPQGLSLSGYTLSISNEALSLASNTYQLVAFYGSYASAPLILKLSTADPVATSYTIYSDAACTVAIDADTLIAPVSGTGKAQYWGQAFDQYGAKMDGFIPAWSISSGAAITIEKTAANLVTLNLGQGSGSYTLKLNDSAALALTLCQQLAAPTLVETEWTSGAIAGWDSVSNASSYNVLIYKGLTKVASLAVSGDDTSIDCSDAIAQSGSGSYTFSVEAVGSGSYATSAESSPSTATHESVMTTFRSLTIGMANESAVGDTESVVTFPVTATSIGYGTYPVTPVDVPAPGVRFDDLVIEEGSGTLTLYATLSQGYYPMSIRVANITASLSLTVSAKCYAVAINGGGVGASGTGDYEEGASVSIFAGTRAGYTFSGWTSDDISLTDSSAASTEFTMPGKAVTVTATWTENPTPSYLISFDAAGGSVSESARSIAQGTAIGTLPTPTRSGYSFSGWYTAASGGTMITAATIPSENVTYYARWTSNSSGYINSNPSSGGSPAPAPTPSNTSTVDVNGQSLRVNALSNGDILSVSMSAVQRSAIIQASDELVLIDLSDISSKSDADPSTVRLSKTDVQQFAAADKGLELVTEQGSIALDSAALASLADQLGSGIVDISLEQVGYDQLNDAQQQQLREAMSSQNPDGAFDPTELLIVDINILNGKVAISEFEGILTVTLPYSGEYNENLTIWYINEDGSLTEMPTSYDADTGTISFQTNHLSLYAIGYKAAAADTSSGSKPVEPPVTDEPSEKEDPILLVIGSSVIVQGDDVLAAPDVVPQIIGGRTMLPFRYLIQTLLGGDVDWNGDTRVVTAEVGGHSFWMTIDEESIIVDGRATNYGQAPVIVDGRTLVPLRAFEAAVQSIGWDEATQTVTIVK